MKKDAAASMSSSRSASAIEWSYTRFMTTRLRLKRTARRLILSVSMRKARRWSTTRRSYARRWSAKDRCELTFQAADAGERRGPREESNGGKHVQGNDRSPTGQARHA